ncbi:MAG: ABC transporter ATP-binding protein [Thermoleophilia bacterium]|nr:ABC transporter ATP-binding protein [Thermoleophilia bacterium]
MTTASSVGTAAVRADGLGRRYGDGEAAIDALRDVTVEFPSGQFAAVMGPSGSGKSTLLHCLAGLDRPTSGEVVLGGMALAALSDKELTVLRRTAIGFVFQSFNLLPMLTAEENVALPLRIAGVRDSDDRVAEVLAEVGLTDRRTHRPAELSGGQQQRVAIARALVANPTVIFADEPTGNLDSVSGTEILYLLRRAVDEGGRTVVMVTHDPRAATIADRVVLLSDGVVVMDRAGMTADEIYDAVRTLDTA